MKRAPIVEHCAKETRDIVRSIRQTNEWGIYPSCPRLWAVEGKHISEHRRLDGQNFARYAKERDFGLYNEAAILKLQALCTRQF
jgi:hypothetical protein